MTRLRIDIIRLDGGTQMRVGINEEHVASCAERMEAGDSFPAVVVFHDGATYWLADGFHRITARSRIAAKHVGTDEHDEWSVIDVDLHAGTRLDAIRWAIGANRTNGLRRTNADKQLAVKAALAHPDLSDKSDRAIADAAGVSHFMVAQLRQVAFSSTSPQPDRTNHKAVNTESDKRFRTGVDGKQYPVRQKASAPKSAAKRATWTGHDRTEEKKVSSDSESRASAIAKHRKICPMCNGEGYVDE